MVANIRSLSVGQGADGGADVGVPRQTLYGRVFKRWIDVAMAGLAIVVAAPLLVAVAVVVRFTIGRGVLIRQHRVGRGGRDFEMLKFRTMQHCRRREQQSFPGPDRRSTHKSSEDPRHTAVGKFLRRTSLDELPQLFNVLKGDMSLVGPRPEISEVADRYGLRYHPRHRVRPGLTGEFQTTVRNDGALLHEHFDLDFEAALNPTLADDVRILVRTVAVVLSAKGQ